MFDDVDPKPLPRMDEPAAEPALACLCPGCPVLVPTSWASGLCGPCANGDCLHNDADGESW